ncbi:MAG: dihydrodipicolinate synthase family protein, partial [Gemmatimonadota bacterium]
ELDEESLEAQVRFCIEAGAAGLAGPANASEYLTLSDDERRRWLEVVLAAAGGEVPVIASVTSGHAVPAAALARFAQERGAAGVMSMPPPLQGLDEAGCFAYYRHLAGAVDIPVVVQDYNAPMGTPMAPALLARLCRELRRVEYVKEEVSPEPRRVSAVLAAAGTACRGVFGGAGGIYLLDEHRRGAAGNMPGPHVTDVLVQVWQSLERGDGTAARRLFDLLLPLMASERLYGVAVYKEVLRRRGVIATACRRTPGGPLEPPDLVEVDAAMAMLAPAMAWRPPTGGA